MCVTEGNLSIGAQCRLHDNLRFSHRLADAFVRKNTSAVDEQLVLDLHILPEYAHVLHSHPASDGAFPAHDTRIQPRVRLHKCVLHDRAPTHAHSLLDHYAWPDHNVRPDPTSGVNASRGVLWRQIFNLNSFFRTPSSLASLENNRG